METTELVDINENRHRYYFTREATQKDMEACFGIKIQTIGKYYPNRAMAAPNCPPLAIQLKGPEGSVLSATEFVEKVLQEGPPSAPLVTYSGQITKAGKFETRVYLGFQAEPGRVSAVRGRILGPPPAASHLAYIARIAGPSTFVGLRGQGSGHVQPGMTPEQLTEPMHLLIQCSSEQELANATALAEDLVMVVRHEHENNLLR